MGDWLSKRWEHLAKEWRVIWEAKSLFGTAAIALVVATTLGVWNVAEWHHAGIEASLQATNDMLREELKGASPQLAAIQSRRVALRTRLQSLYTESGALERRDLSIDPKTGASPDDEINKYIADEKDWEDTTTKWLRDNLGDAAAERFLDVSRGNSYSFYSNPKVNATVNRIVHLRQNLETLLETAAYDK